MAVEDPRCSGKVKHHLTEALVIAVRAVIACAKSWDNISAAPRGRQVKRDHHHP